MNTLLYQNKKCMLSKLLDYLQSVSVDTLQDYVKCSTALKYLKDLRRAVSFMCCHITDQQL